MAIAVVNFIFGWTFPGWVLSLIWALSCAGIGVVAMQIVVTNNHIATAGELGKYDLARSQNIQLGLGTGSRKLSRVGLGHILDSF
jgi:hypothetical protein